MEEKKIANIFKHLCISESILSMERQGIKSREIAAVEEEKETLVLIECQIETLS
jgi:hypothetical protein